VKPTFTMVAALMFAAPGLARADFSQDQIDKGRYLAVAGNCTACHTAPGGAYMAGGLPMETPVGTVYSTNITPDPATGIGGYSYDEFAAAVRDGVAKGGHKLYPAMPYPSYTKVSDADMQALYAYFTKGVTAVSQKNKDTDIPWPLSMRWTLAVWNALYVDFGRHQPAADKDAQWNRGAYLVEGLGHCGSCHTPRGLGFQEKAMGVADGAAYLAGANIDGWHAKDLRGGKGAGLGSWSEADLTRFLKTGRNDFTAAFGGMVEVISHSTQHLSDNDLTAMARYLKSLSPTPGTDVAAAASDATFTALKSGDYSTRGATAYMEYCASCHRPDGKGAPSVYPALAGNSAVLTQDATSVIRITLDGGHMAATPHDKMAFAMPAFDRLDDATIADMVSFVRGGWGNHAGAVAASDVAALRKVSLAAKQRLGLPTEIAKAKLPEGVLPFAPKPDTAMPAGEKGELIRLGRRLLTDTKHLLPDNVGAGMNCTNCHMNGGKTPVGGAFYGSAPTFPQFNPRAGREVTLKERVNGCMMRSMNGKPLKPDSKEMTAIIAYFDWLSEGIPKDAKVAGRGVGNRNMPHVPDPANGQKVYGEKCAACHGDNGEGLKDAQGEYIFPPLWGDESFNIGAGMARTYTAAAFVLNNMPIAWGTHWPLGQGKALTEQEAVDVSEYFTHQPRPDFAAKVKDWPDGKKPKDARY